MAAYGQVVDVRIEGAPLVPGTPGEGAFKLLRFGLSLIAIVAGLDKFSNALVNWEQYLAPSIASWLPVSVPTFMRIGGIAEIAVGILVAVNPRAGGKVMGLWLAAIIVNLLMVPGYYDIAARDFGLSLAAFSLSGLAAHRELSRPVVTMPAHAAEPPPVPSHV